MEHKYIWITVIVAIVVVLVAVFVMRGSSPTGGAVIADCGNGACDVGETHASCDADCGPICGDGACDPDEKCAADCKEVKATVNF